MRPVSSASDSKISRRFVHLREGIEAFLRFARGRVWEEASMRERLHAFSVAVRRPMLDAMRETERRYRDQDSKRLYYLSMEFLMGRALGNNLANLELYDESKAIIAELGVDLEELEALEHDAALGNGGLGRLAACFLDSLATQNMPGFGYGINYEFGLFRQTFVNGYQHEKPDHWLDEGGSPWMIERPDEAIVVPVYGAIAHTSIGGVYQPSWVDFKVIVGVPYDMPIAGYGGETVNVLRLFTARSSDEFDIGIFNSGDYIAAVQHKINTEAISKILYPSDSVDRGRELRLLQEYFLVACSVRDIVKRYLETHDSFDDFAEKVAIQMNDTHPALTVVELMRMFIDDYAQPWEQAWATTVATCGYTNHTLLPEALEKWPFDLLERLLPRHLQIMQEINRRVLAEVERRFPGDLVMQQRVSLFDDGDRRNVRMGNLAMAGSHSINGVAALHSELVKTTLAPDFYKLYPERFNNKTNGVTPRRWLLHANRPLASLITRAVGDGWIRNLDELRRLELFDDDASFLERLDAVKDRNKLALAALTEQISTAGKEASGTGNMKLALNGALTIGTLDGANIEIRDEVGEENIFIFGLKAGEVAALLPSYRPEQYLANRAVRRIVDTIAAGHFSRGDKEIFRPIVAKLTSARDEYVHLADLEPYLDTQRRVEEDYLDRRGWSLKSLRNIARMGKFSSDRTIAEYARDIWNIKPA